MGEPDTRQSSFPEPDYGTDGGFVWITFKRPNSDTAQELSDKLSTFVY